MKAIIFAALLLGTIYATEQTLSIEGYQGRYIVNFKDECKSSAFQQAVVESIPAEESLFLENLNMYIVKAPKTKIMTAINSVSVEDISLRSCIESIEEDQLRSLDEFETTTKQSVLDLDVKENDANVEFNYYYAWHLDRINARSGLDGNSTLPFTTTTQSDVYIIDSGIDRNHVWLSANCASGDSNHFVAFQDTDNCGFYACDSNSHGTHVSGLVASAVYGGNPHATLHAVKVFDVSGSTTNSVILNGINWVISHAKGSSYAATANMSLGGGYSSSFNSAVGSLISNDIHTAVAAGNESSNACWKSPASEPSVLTIGSSDSQDGQSWFSNYGSCVDFYAPGSDILSTLPNNYVGYKSGTSMATPVVVGFVSAVAASDPSYYKNPAAVQTAVKAALTPNVVSGAPNNADLLYNNLNTTSSASYGFAFTFVIVCVAAVGLIAHKKKQNAGAALLEENYGKMI